MSNEPPTGPGQPQPPNGPSSFSQDVLYPQVSARVPEKIGRGATSTGVIVLQGTHEFVLDFVQRLASPQQLVARVVLPLSLMPALIGALQENLKNYTQRFGPPPALPPLPPNMPQPRIDEIYEQLKLPDETLAGAYANTVMIVHSPAEFCLDFITNVYPRSVVSSRVYMSAFHVPRVVDSLLKSYEQYQKKTKGQGEAGKSEQ